MEPTTFDKMKMGAMMGGTVGLCVGLVFGTINILRYGSGQRGAISMLGSYMAGSAASFGFFMSIGSVIRSEGHQNQRITWPSQTPLGMRPNIYVAPRKEL
ncbi:reactive mitochondrial oxygen species modulator 1-domain-containing protein [Umbelopsis sp. PMI_123]|nr:reactive mitochondrial oxygen species modulator 1-domain-containing protein [Umbelopsis sp. PMI_123]